MSPVTSPQQRHFPHTMKCLTIIAFVCLALMSPVASGEPSFGTSHTTLVKWLETVGLVPPHCSGLHLILTHSLVRV